MERRRRSHAVAARIPLPAALVVAASLLASAPVCAAELTPADIAAQRQASLNGILTTFPADAVAAQRVTCMMGEEPRCVIDGRQAGKAFMPDAVDTCVAVLVRTAHDGHLPDLYRTLLTELGGDAGAYESLPAAIGDAVMNGNGKVAIGNGKDTEVPPTLAFDAGFTLAYLRADTRAANLASTDRLRQVAEACLAVREPAGTCFSYGYMQGGLAVEADK
jgi:hypothetical protein